MKDAFLWVILPLVLAELVLIGPWLAERLLRWGSRWLPEDYQKQYVDDWLGELDAVPGSLTKLAFAIRVVVRVPATERALTGRDALWILVVRRVLVLLITGLLIAVQLLIRLWTRVPGRAPTEGMSGWRMAWVRVAERLALRQMRMRAYLVKRYATLNLQEPLVDAVEPPFQGKQVLARNTPLDSTSMRPRTIQAFRSIGVSTTDQLVEWYFENHLMQGAYGEIQRVPDKDWDEAIRVVLSDVLIYGD